MKTLQAPLNKAIGYHQAGQLDKARTLYRKILKQDQENADAWHLLGVVFYQIGELDIAENNIKKAIELNPGVASFYTNLGLVCHQRAEYEGALENYRKALTLQPAYPEAWNNLGNALQEKGIKGSAEHDEALQCYQKALHLAPYYAEAMNNLANLLSAYGKHEEAIHYYEAALRINPRYKEAMSNLAIRLYRKGEYAKSIGWFEQALAHTDGMTNPLLLSTFYEAKRQICQWDGCDELENKLLTQALDRDNPTLVDPFAAVAKIREVSKEQQRFLNQKYMTNFVLRNRCYPGDEHTKRQEGKIRVGYVSADLYNHAMMHLVQGLFERHDREFFDVILFALKKDEKSGYYQRVKAGVDQLIDLSALDDASAARMIREAGIDILIDLNALTANSRPAIFAYRPAPVQIQYLAYPGTMGCGFMDYVITDRVITPEEDAPFFGEKFLYMPDCYQVNDGDQAIASEIPSRKSCGLPEEAFVYASFNTAYKIEPLIFTLWMDILRENEKSVLWLLADNPDALNNLKNEAQKRGVNPDRLIFGEKLPKAEHLARLKNADLILDTYFYNGHTSSSDALYAGVPVITCKGDRMASRVAASILEALDMPECIVSDFAAYRELALSLASEEGRLAALRSKLEENKKTSSLFDTKQFTKDLETGLQVIWKNHIAGNQPRTLSVTQEVL